MTPSAPALLRALHALTDAHPLATRLLVMPDINHARELLGTLARLRGGWIGWEAATPRTVAEALARVPLEAEGVRLAGDVQVRALLNRAVDAALRRGATGERFAGVAGSLGFRRAVRDTLLELRTAGVAAPALRAAVERGSAGAELPGILAEYERLLGEARVADAAAVFRLALASFDAEAPFVLPAVIALAPTLETRGLAGALVTRLAAWGGVVLEADTPRGLPAAAHRLGDAAAAGPCSPLAWAAAPAHLERAPTGMDRTLVEVDAFAAATPSDEIREVCRRVLAEGLRWDQVEIAATDPDAYGIALDALCQRLGFGATMLRGIPLSRTRIGRALERWLAWLAGGLPADLLRQALEAGELNAPGAPVTSTQLAAELRALQVGWGRARYEEALARLEDGRRAAEITRREEESAEAFAERHAARSRVMDALAALLRALLAATPAVPEAGEEGRTLASCASLARATLAFLALVPVHGAAEGQTLERVCERLAELAAVEEPETGFPSALAALREALAEQRAWPLVTSERKPWSAAGGMPHLTTVDAAGATGRPRTFVVGLDADRVSGAAGPDPLLPDGVRRALPGLATSVERREARTWRLGSALAGLRGRVTLSYATSGALDGREAGPSGVLLQASRLLHDAPELTFAALRESLLPPACAVPASAAHLDARDTWLAALADGPLLRGGGSAVGAGFPMLAAGFAAAAEAAGDALLGRHGLIPEAGPLLDPLARPDRPISPSALETLSACPLRWFYRYGLRLRPPEDPAYDAARWLDALQRGSLLHEVFERFTREFRGRQDALASEAARTRVLAVVDEAVARWRETVPPPGEAVFDAERDELRRAALAFLQMERELRAAGDDAVWEDFEVEFGEENPPGEYPLPDGRVLPVRGRADRVDALPDGSLRVIDYKTGSARRFARNARAPFNGARQLQPALYAAALATPARPVSSFEYRFPGTGGNQVVAYTAEEMEPVRETVAALLAQVAAGEFVPTTENDDCAYCDFAAICRVARDGRTTTSPRAAWAAAHAEHPAFASMLSRRGAAALEAALTPEAAE